MLTICWTALYHSQLIVHPRNFQPCIPRYGEQFVPAVLGKLMINLDEPIVLLDTHRHIVMTWKLTGKFSIFTLLTELFATLDLAV